MNNETKNHFINGVETINISEEELVLAAPTELFDEAKAIAQSTSADEKFPFAIQYDSNQKEFLLSVLQAASITVETDDEEGHMLNTQMNMTQLAFIKRLDCVVRVKTDEGINPFLFEKEMMSDAVENTTAQTQESDITVQATMLLSDEPVMEAADINEVAVASANNCPTNTDMASAQAISVETNVSGCICCPGAEQWFKFTVPKTATYTIYTTGALDTIGTLYDRNEDEIVEVDDYEPCGNLNFRIIKYLTANRIYYIRVREANTDTGSYNLKVTGERLVDSVSVSPSEITLNHIGKVYELPITPGSFTNIGGAEPLTTLVASILPEAADEKKVFWNSSNNDIIRVDSGWHDGQRYQTVTVMGFGTAKLYAYDWNENGKRGECTVNAGGGWPVYAKPSINSRESWGAREVVNDRLKLRVRDPEMIIFHHTADKFTSTNVSDIVSEIKETQNEHIDKEKKCDIAYHFVIDPAGGIWQGAMVDEYQRGHANGHFDDIGVVLLGDFENRIENLFSPNTLNENQKNAIKELSKWLCYEYDLPIEKINGVSPITTHKAASGGTQCPGDNAEPWVENDLRTYINNWHP